MKIFIAHLLGKIASQLKKLYDIECEIVRKLVTNSGQREGIESKNPFKKLNVHLIGKKQYFTP